MIRPLSWRLAALAAGAAFLPACAGVLPGGRAGDQASPTATAPTDTVMVHPPALPPAVPPPPPPPPKRLATADLVGRPGTDINRLFGQPRLLRREAPAEVWQFPGATCTLLVFLYPDEVSRASDQLVVQHVDAVPPARGAKVVDEDCVESLLRDRTVPVS